ncbi:hypothetical protein M8818_007313 [Zalaria obscura]|uniref:Uncharacterized protein n=1 Tax=Zalaria obscura TaxID=2024903 RepID=A0ACC3S308_9PEZI
MHFSSYAALAVASAGLAIAAPAPEPIPAKAVQKSGGHKFTIPQIAKGKFAKKPAISMLNTYAKVGHFSTRAHNTD